MLLWLYCCIVLLLPYQTSTVLMQQPPFMLWSPVLPSGSSSLLHAPPWLLIDPPIHVLWCINCLFLSSHYLIVPVLSPASLCVICQNQNSWKPNENCTFVLVWCVCVFGVKHYVQGYSAEMDTCKRKVVHCNLHFRRHKMNVSDPYRYLYANMYRYDTLQNQIL